MFGSLECNTFPVPWKIFLLRKGLLQEEKGGKKRGTSNSSEKLKLRHDAGIAIGSVHSLRGAGLELGAGAIDKPFGGIADTKQQAQTELSVNTNAALRLTSWICH